MDTNSYKTMKLTNLGDVKHFDTAGNYIYIKRMKDELESTAYRINKDGGLIQNTTDSYLQTRDRRYVYYIGSKNADHLYFPLVRKSLLDEDALYEEVLSKYEVDLDGFIADEKSDTFAFVETENNNQSPNPNFYLHIFKGDKEIIKIVQNCECRPSIITIKGEWIYFTTDIGIYRIRNTGTDLQKVGNGDAVSSYFLGRNEDYLVFLTYDYKKFIFIN